MKPTQPELIHMRAVKDLPCSVCGEAGPSDAHHILEGRIPGRKSPNFLVIPLCKDCHQGNFNGIHGQKRVWDVLKKNELVCLAETIEILYGEK